MEFGESNQSDNEPASLLKLDMEVTDPLMKKVFIFGQKYKDTVGIFVLSSETIDDRLSQKYKRLFKLINSKMAEHNQTIVNKIKINFPPLKEKNGVYYFFYNRLNSFVSFKENLIRANFLSNKMKVKRRIMSRNK